MNARAAMSSAPKRRLEMVIQKKIFLKLTLPPERPWIEIVDFFIPFTKAGTLSLKCGYFYLRTHYKPGFILILRVEIILPSRLFISHILWPTASGGDVTQAQRVGKTDRNPLQYCTSSILYLPTLENDKINYLLHKSDHWLLLSGRFKVLLHTYLMRK